MGVQSQLGTLSQIIRAIDPKLHQHLGMAVLLCRIFICHYIFSDVHIKPLLGVAVRRLLKSNVCFMPLLMTEGYISILIEELDGGEYLFAIRMLMVLFRREFSFVDAMYLWEVQTPISLIMIH